MSIRIALCLIFSAFNACVLLADSPDGTPVIGDSPSLNSPLGLGSPLLAQAQQEEKTIVLPEASTPAATQVPEASQVIEQPNIIPGAGEAVQPVVQGIAGNGCTSAQSAFAPQRCNALWGRVYKSSQFSYQVWQGYAEQRAREEQCKLETVLSPCLSGKCSGSNCHGMKLHSKHWLPKYQINAVGVGAPVNCDSATTRPLGPPVLPAAALRAESSYR